MSTTRRTRVSNDNAKASQADDKPKQAEWEKLLPPQPSRWNSFEFYILYILAAISCSWVLYESIRHSQEYGAWGTKLAPRVSTGWLFSFYMDLSDHQWRMWRSYLPIISAAMIVFLSISHYLKRKPSINRDNRATLIYYSVFGAVMLTYIHGADVLLLYAVTLVNYLLTKALKANPALPFVVWTWNLLILFLSDYYVGFNGLFTRLGLKILDKYHGVFSWHVYFKLSMLRHISFSMDYYWMKRKREVMNLDGRSDYTKAQELHQPEHSYGLMEYLAYVYYLPFFMTGPIVTFNAFIAQVKNPQKTYSMKQIFIELVKVAIYMLGLEIWLHFFYHFSFSENRLWKSQNFTPYQVCFTGFWTLNFMYMKFLIIWRFFRVMGLFDGIDSPENMNRCVNNNFTFTGFWRSWHGSLNKWIVRYLYVPLGGSKTQQYTIWLIFTFIGLWHDLKTRWLAWALLNCVFFSIEIIILKIFYSTKWLWLWKKSYYRYLVAVAGVTNIFLLMVANLAILYGFEYTPVFLYRAFIADGGVVTLLGAYCWLFIGVLWMLEIREGERRAQQMKRF